MGISRLGFVMCLDLLTSVLMKMREGAGGLERWGVQAGAAE
jgi:hypothetical protein